MLNLFQHLYAAILTVRKGVIPVEATAIKSGQENTGFPRIKYGAGLVKPGMTDCIRLMSSCAGLSLIELMVALVLSSILIGSIYQTLRSQQKTYTVQDQVVDMQQNARAAIGQMMREIRMAGYGNVSQVLPVTIGGRTFSNILNPDVPSAGALTIVSASGSPATITSVPARNQIIVSSVSDFDTGNRRYLSIGGIESRTISSIDTGTKTITLTGNMIFGHPAGTRVFPVRATSYQVIMEGSTPVLKEDGNLGGGFQPLAENIEAVQFEYFDANNAVTANPPDIRMIRVTVTARTDRVDPDYQGGGGYRRRQVVSNVQVRNMGISP